MKRGVERGERERERAEERRVVHLVKQNRSLVLSSHVHVELERGR